MKSIMRIKQRFRTDYARTLTPFRAGLLLVLWGLVHLTASAQTDPLEQAKLDIWTETASFVYRDAKLTEPASITNASTLKQFVTAIQQDDRKSQIYSKLYKPIEETGTYRKGKDPKAQLDLLIRSINTRLRDNEQRMKDINRRQRLSDLYKQLQQIATDYTNPTAADPGLPPDPSTTGDESFVAPDNTRTDPDTAVESAYTENQLSSLSKRQPQDQNKTTDWMTIAALILSLLALGLTYFLYTKITAVEKRIDQRKKDIDFLTQQVNGPGRKSTADANGKISREEVERLVQKAVARETARLKPASAAPPAPKETPAAPKETPAPTPRVELPAESEDALLSPPPVSIPSVPVAITPEPEPEPTPAPAPAPDKPQSLFARVPVNGGFHEQDLNPAQQHDSIYEIRISRKDPSRAAFRIVPNSPVHRTAIESAYLSLKDACVYQLNNQHATNIITDEPGTLTYQDGFWVIDKKANIHFE